MMKIFRYALVALFLSLISSHARSQTLTTAYDLSTAAAGNSYVGNSNFMGMEGMEFDVNAPGIKITSLGIFDSGGDGFHNVLTAYLFNASTEALVTTPSFNGTLSFSGTNGTLIGYNRFINIPGGVVLGPGTYIVAAYGFSSADPSGAETLPNFVPDTFNSDGGVITMASHSVYEEAAYGPGAFPRSSYGDGLAYNATSFQYSLYVPEPGSVVLMGSLIGMGNLMAYRTRQRRAKK